MVALINCVINHNARDPGAAQYAGMNHDVVEVLQKHDAGIIQMPCPEMSCLGLHRTRRPDESILDVLDTPEGRSCCGKLSASVADTIEEFRRNGYTVAALLGGDTGSPGCAVPAPPISDDALSQGTGFGVFTKALLSELRSRDVQIPIRGVRDSNEEALQTDLAWLDDLLTEPSADHHSGAAV